MPELPEVDAVVRRLGEGLGRARVEEIHIERAGTVAPQSAEDFEVLRGAPILGARRRAKYIFLEFPDDVYLRIHLRMTGNLYLLPDWRFRPHAARVWLRLKDRRALIFEDSRALGKVHVVTGAEIAALEASLGPEPLEEGFTAARLAEILSAVRGPVKPALMDQKRIAGVGNIYASEALWHARIHPAVAGREVSRKKVVALHAAIQKVLRHAVSSAYAEYSQPGTVVDSESFGVAVYGREGEMCEACGKEIVRIVQGGRSTFFCAKCQR
jgi:formamidopyrimidine-DNA glycosylase